MPTRTTQQLFGLKDPELNALAVVSGLEGFRGAAGQDVAAVASNLLARRLSGQWGGVDIRNIAKSPGQYESVFKYSMDQLADPTFAAKVLGGQSEFERIRNIVNNPSLVGEQFQRSKGAQSFRGVSAYGSKKPEDYTPVPGQSNFYFNPLDPKNYQRGVGIFGNQAAEGSAAQQNAQALQIPTPQAKANSLLDIFKQQVLEGILSPGVSALPPTNPFDIIGLLGR